MFLFLLNSTYMPRADMRDCLHSGVSLRMRNGKLIFGGTIFRVGTIFALFA